MMESASDYFRRRSVLMDDGTYAKCVNADIPVAYDYDGLKDHKEFRSFLALTYRRGD